MDYSVFDTVPVGVCVLRRDRGDMTCLYANTALESLLGINLVGRPFEEIWPSKDTAELAKKLRSPVPPIEATLPIDRNARKSWALLAIDETRYEGDDTYTIWATDISASKEAEEAMRMAAERADAISQQKSNFLATISHEIRTPMQSVYGLLEMMELEDPDPNIMNMVQTARDSSTGLLQILDDVLDFAKMDADQMELDLFEVPLRGLVRSVIESLGSKIHGKNIILKDEISSDVPDLIVGDPKRLRQIIINLMSNALKFTHNGAVVIRVMLAEKTTGKRFHLRFEVIDTGIGMSEDASARLFKPFAQADNSTSRKYGGTGLGLSICKKLIDLMNGHIGVKSEQGKGSVFWFEIPTEEADLTQSTFKLPKLEGISILVVEDHPETEKELCSALKSMGAKIESCGTVAEGIRLATRRPFDVGIIDYGLPDGTGLELMRDIAEIRPFMGMILHTVLEDSALVQSVQALGAIHLPKPASRMILGEAVLEASHKIVTNNASGSRKLVIAEDTASVRDVLKRQLDKMGVEATFVEDGREAIEAVRSGEYGILITDLHMPDVDGYEVVKTLRDDDQNLNRHFPIIALTADVQLAQRQVYMGHGFDECILKPVSLGQFRRLLTRWGLVGNTSSTQHEAAAENNKNDAPSSVSAIDRKAVEEQMGAFDADAIEMLKMFVEMSSSLMERIVAAEKDKNFHDLAEAAHSLKGGARSACLNILGDYAAQLQTDAENKTSCTGLVQDVVKAFEQAKEEINAL